MYSITELARRLHVHNQTLRNWEKQGLILPKRIGKVRVYSEEDLRHCEEIKRYSGRGVNLKGIRELLLAHERNHKSGGGV